MSQPVFAARDRISLCMIVRNEEAKLARAIASAQPWVGEIVVVDTGSTDRTVAIAEASGARVVHFPWCDDFSAARNASLDAATREWALVLDADEEWVVVDPVELGKAVSQDVLDGFSFRYDNMLDDGAIGRSMVFRLFRRTLPGMRYRGALHEQVLRVADRQATTAALACAVIRHDGHTSEAMSQGKTERNLKLAHKLTASRPGDPFSWYALGISSPAAEPRPIAQAYEKALALLDAQGRTGEGEGYVVHLFHHLTQAYRVLKEDAKALALLERGVATFPASPDLHFARGDMRLARHDYLGARADFEACLAPEAAAFYVICDPATVGAGAHTGLGLALLNVGHYDDAEQHLRRAIAMSQATYAAPRRTLGLMLAQRGAWPEALPLLHAALAATPADEEVRFHTGWCLAKLERHDEAEEALKPLSDRPDAQHLLGKVYLESGRGDEALALLEACPLPAAGLARGWAYYLDGRAGQAADCWQEWLRAGAADWGTKDTLSTFMFLLQGGRRPTGEPERPAEPLRDMDHWFRLLLRYERFDDVESAVRRGPELGDRLWKPLRRKWAITLAKEGFYDVSLSLLLQAREAEPQDGEVYYWLGFCSLHKQLVGDAKVMWETCLRYAPDHSLAAQALSLLR